MPFTVLKAYWPVFTNTLWAVQFGTSSRAYVSLPYAYAYDNSTLPYSTVIHCTIIYSNDIYLLAAVHLYIFTI